MAAKTINYANAWLQLVFNAVEFVGIAQNDGSPVTELYVSLHTTDHSVGTMIGDSSSTAVYLTQGSITQITVTWSVQANDLPWSVQVNNLSWSVQINNLEWSEMAVTTNVMWHVGEDVQLNGVPQTVIDISSWTIVFEILNLLTVTFSLPATITNGPNGLFNVTIPAASTTALGLGVFPYQMRRIDSGFNTVLANGRISAVA